MKKCHRSGALYVCIFLEYIRNMHRLILLYEHWQPSWMVILGTSGGEV